MSFGVCPHLALYAYPYLSNMFLVKGLNGCAIQNYKNARNGTLMGEPYFN